MKIICFFAGAIFISIAATAQVTPSNPLDEMKLNPAIGGIKIPVLPVPKLTGIAPLGNLYAMPPDNMPCLVPNFADQNSMPVSVTPFASPFIPNSLPRQQLPEAPFRKKNLLKLDKAPKKVAKNLMLDLIRKK